MRRLPNTAMACTIIKNKTDLLLAIKTYKKVGGSVVFFDTETTGLNIKYDTPFLLPWGFFDKDAKNAYIYCVDREADKDLFRQTALTILKLAEKDGLCGHNIKFDLHMLRNIDIDLPEHIHYIDTMIYIRLAHDALTPANGGPPLGLKDYASRFIDKDAKATEKILRSGRTAMSKQFNKELKDALYKIDRM